MRIKNTSIFSAKLPDAKVLAQAFEEMKLRPIGEIQALTVGFHQNYDDKFVTAFPGGIYFEFAITEKKVNKKAFNQKVAQLVQEEEQDTGVKSTKQRVKQISDQLMCDVLKVALAETRIIPVFYSPEKNYLICATASKPDADRAVTALVRASESVQTATIHVDEVAAGLTARMDNYLNERDNAFGPFTISEKLKLRGEEGTVTFDFEDLAPVIPQIRESLALGMCVVAIQFVHNSILEFNLTDKLQMRSLSMLTDYEDASDEFTNEEDELEKFKHEAGIEMLLISSAMDDLCQLFGKQRELFIDETEEEKTDA